MAECNDTIIVTGSAGFIGSALIKKFARRFALVGLDRVTTHRPQPTVDCINIDLTSEDSIAAGLQRVRTAYGSRIASVIHLAAYFDLTGEPNPLYDEITVRGTEKLLHALQSFEVEQFIFASSMLAHKAGRLGDVINEDSPLQTDLPYRASKIEAERLIHEQHGPIPIVYIRPAGVYDGLCRNAFLANQIVRIYERNPAGHVYPGNLQTGQSFLHLEDLLDAVARLIERRNTLALEETLLLGESEVIGYGDLQAEIGRLLHGETWKTREIPKTLAKAGTWVQQDLLGEDSFIRPWMIDIADDHYAIDIARAGRLLGWKPEHSLRKTLPRMIAALKADPVGWYQANKLNAAKVAGKGTTSRERSEALHASHEKIGPGRMMEMAGTGQRMLWAHFLVVVLGIWLLTSPLQFALFDPEAARAVHDITQERGLPEQALRNALTGWSDIASGVLLMLFGSLALSRRFSGAQWGSTGVGLWLLFAPLFFWTPSAGGAANDTIIGALAITFSVLVPMMPGMSREGMMDSSTVPPGWTYSPSSWLQRLPIIALGFFGFLIARYLAAYQLGQVGAVWEPFFSGDGRNGTEFIITSAVSRSWPIPDAGLGAAAYLIEALMGAMGTATRWRTMPWMVAFFFVLVVPLGGVSIFFITIQPIVIGTYCTLCLLAALAMLVMIPLTLDEVVAMAQYMQRSLREGRPFWRTFFRGGPEPRGGVDESDPGFTAALGAQSAAAVRGVTVPWTLAACCVAGAWLMLSRLVLGTGGITANNDHLIGALIITIAVCAMAEVARPLRFVNLLLGLWLIAAPWLLSGGDASSIWNDVAIGIAVVGLSPRRGTRSKEHYGSWDRYVV
jgi:nucleoside-diphosphate-sugar epimerase